MVTFSPSVNPSYNSPKAKSFRVLIANFGDGYHQRVGDGINVSSEEWSLRWDLLTQAQADEITDFFDARAGTESFDWLTPDGDTKNFFVSSYNRTPIANDIFSIAVIFNEDLNN